MSAIEIVVRVWLCGMAAMLVMGVGGIVRNVYAALTVRSEDDEPEE